MILKIQPASTLFTSVYTLGSFRPQVVYTNTNRIRKMFFNNWTRKLLFLPLCSFVVGFLTYLVAICSLIHTVWTNISHPQGHNDSESFHSSTDASSLSILCLSLSWEVLMSLSAVIYMATEVRGGSGSYSNSLQIFSAFFSIVSIIFIAFDGDILVGIVRNSFSRMYQSNFAAASNPTTQLPTIVSTTTPLSVALALIGTLVKGTSWLTFMAITFFYALPSKANNYLQDQHSSNTRTAITNGATAMLIATLMYCTAMTWMEIGSKIEYGIVFSKYISFCNFLGAVLLMGCTALGKIHSVIIGLFLCILGIYLTFLVEILIDLGRALHICGIHWTEICIKVNPVYFCTLISSIVAGTLVWMFIFKLWSVPGKPTSSTEVDLNHNLEEAGTTTCTNAANGQKIALQPLNTATSLTAEKTAFIV